MNFFKKAYLATLDFARRNAGKVMAGVALVGSLVGSAHAEDPTDAAGIVTAASGLLTAVYPVVIGAVCFGILVSLVKLLKKR